MKVNNTIFFFEYKGFYTREGYGHPDLRIAAYRENEAERIFYPNGSSHWETELYFADFRIWCQCSRDIEPERSFNPLRSIYAWNYRYYGYQHLDSSDIKRMAKTCNKIDSYLRRVDKQHGRAESFGVYAFRIAKALNMPIKRKGRYGWLEVDAFDINNDAFACWRELNPVMEVAA